MSKGKFIISIDFELQYGLEDISTLYSYKENIVNGRKAIDEMLKLFDEYQIHATWAVVGMMLCENKNELLSYFPKEIPVYENKVSSIYDHMDRLGNNEDDDPYHYGLSIVKKIAKCKNQEIASHTFSHFYCNNVKNENAFDSDLIQNNKVFVNKIGFAPRTIVFPRNQINQNQIKKMSQFGIDAFRGCQHNIIYRNSSTNVFVRALRLIDNYLNITGSKIYNSPVFCDGVADIKASMFLRPFNKKMSLLEPLKLHRIKSSLKKAAKKGAVFHLWWHPHNFGSNTKENLAQLAEILSYYSFLRKKYGMISMNMGEMIHNE